MDNVINENVKIKKKSKYKVLIIVAVVALILASGTSYAYWKVSKEQTNTNEYITACLDFSLVEEEASSYSDTTNLTTYEDGGVEYVSGFSMDSSMPLSNSDGVNQTGYLFSVTNNCEDDGVSYYIALEEYNEENYTAINSDYINVGINDAIIGTYGNLPTTDTTDEEDAIDARVIYNDYLAAGETKSYKLNLWLKSNTPISEASTSDAKKSWSSRVFVTGTVDNENSEYVTQLTDESCFDIDSTGTITNYHSENSNCGKDVVIPPKVDGIEVKNIATNAFRKEIFEFEEYSEDILYAEAINTTAYGYEKNGYTDNQRNSQTFIDEKIASFNSNVDNDILKAVMEGKAMDLANVDNVIVKTSTSDEINVITYNALSKNYMSNYFLTDPVIDYIAFPNTNENNRLYVTNISGNNSVTELEEIMDYLLENNSGYQAVGASYTGVVLYADKDQATDNDIILISSEEMESSGIATLYNNLPDTYKYIIYKELDYKAEIISMEEYQNLDLSTFHYTFNGTNYDNNSAGDRFIISPYHTEYEKAYQLDTSFNDISEYNSKNIKPSFFATVKGTSGTSNGYTMLNNITLDNSDISFHITYDGGSYSRSISSITKVNSIGDIPNLFDSEYNSSFLYIKGNNYSHLSQYKVYGLKIDSVNLSKATFLENIEAAAFSSMYYTYDEEDDEYSVKTSSYGLTGLFFGDNTNEIVFNSMAFAGANLENLTIYNTYKSTNINEVFSDFLDSNGNQITDIEDMTEEQKIKYLSFMFGDFIAYGQFGNAYIKNLTIKNGTDDGKLSYLESDMFEATEVISATLSLLNKTRMFKSAYINNIVIDEGITEVADYTFALSAGYSVTDGDNTIAPNITLPSTIKKIGEYGTYFKQNVGNTISVNMTESNFTSNVTLESNWKNSDATVTYKES